MAEVQNILPVSQGNVDHGQYTAVSVAGDDLSTSLLQLSDYNAENQTELFAVNDPNFPAITNQPMEGYRFPRTQAAHYPQPICCTFDIIQSFPWAHYDPVKDKLYCHICVMAIKQGRVDFVQDEFITTGFNDWPQATTQLWKHKLRDVHRNARELPQPPRQPTPCTDDPVQVLFPEKVDSVQDELVATGLNDCPKPTSQLWKHKLQDVHRNSREPPKSIVQPAQCTNDVIVNSLPASGAPRRIIHSMSRRYGKWTHVTQTIQRGSYRRQIVVTPESLDTRRTIQADKEETPLLRRCIHPSVAYLIKLVKANPNLYKINILRSHVDSTWRKIGKLMDEAGYAEFKNGRVCHAFWLNLRNKFRRARLRYITVLKTAKDPDEVQKPASVAYYKLLWLAPRMLIEGTHLEGYDMSALDAEQAEDITDEDLKISSDPSDIAAGKGKWYERVIIPKVKPLEPIKPYTRKDPVGPQRVVDTTTIDGLELLSYQLQLLDTEQRGDFQEAVLKLHSEINPTPKDAATTTLRNAPAVTLPANSSLVSPNHQKVYLLHTTF